MELKECSKANTKIVALHIMEYLNRSPNAKDTLEGIAEWWLEREYVEENIEMVAEALSFLCSQEILLKEKASGGSVFYRLNTNETFKDVM